MKKLTPEEAIVETETNISKTKLKLQSDVTPRRAKDLALRLKYFRAVLEVSKALREIKGGKS